MKIKKADCIFLLQTPVHNNLGDHSIVIAEKKLLKDILPKKTVVELSFGIVRRCTAIVQYIVKEAPILIHGGGFIGSVWHEENKLFQKILTMFPNNKIIVFPQTVNYCGDNCSDNKLYTHKNIWMFARELTSYNYIKANFPLVNLLLTPDMALYLNCEKTNFIRKDIIMCMRNDKEKEISEHLINRIYKILLEALPNEKIIQADTIHHKFIMPNQRIKLVKNKIEDFAQAKLIITDRLHGMIFAVLANTPCIAYGKNDGCKVNGVYEWIKDCPSFVYIDNTSDISSAIESLLYVEEYSFNIIATLKEKYAPLISLLRDIYKDYAK